MVRRDRTIVRADRNVEIEINQEPPTRLESRGARDVGIDQEMEKLTQRVGGMRLVISQFKELHPSEFFDNENGEEAEWLKSINYLLFCDRLFTRCHTEADYLSTQRSSTTPAENHRGIT